MANEATDPKEMLRRKKAYILVDFIESPGVPCIPRLGVVPIDILEEIDLSSRTYFLSCLRAWLFLTRATLENNPNVSISVPEQENIYFPPLDELVKHGERTLKDLERAWPFEARFTQQCVPDLETANMVAYPFLVPGGFEIIKTLVPQGGAGYVFRITSPVSYHPHVVEISQSATFPPPILLDPRSLPEFLHRFMRGGQPPEPPPRDIEFPEPPKDT